MTTTATPSPPGPARWAVLAAYAAPLCVLPSAAWRTVGAINGRFGATAWYPILLSAVSFALALLTLGLVHRWGERIPRWVPALGGRRIPVDAAAIPAAVGGLLLLALVGYAVYRLAIQPMDHVDPDLVLVGEKPSDLAPLPERDPGMFREVLWTYAPLAAWPVLLLAVTADYRRRRRARPAAGR